MNGNIYRQIYYKLGKFYLKLVYLLDTFFWNCVNRLNTFKFVLSHPIVNQEDNKNKDYFKSWCFSLIITGHT